MNTGKTLKLIGCFGAAAFCAVGAAFGTGAQSIRFNVPDAATEIRFTFTPNLENPGAVLLRKFAGARGFSISFR